jgi:hypothetical protein
MSEIKVNKISPRTACGTTTLGDSGDTFTIPAGVTITNNGTQTGFGRTGTVDWETTPKTATFTAVSGKGYFCNTTAGAFEMDLPAGSAGDIISVQDYNNTFDSNNLTVDPNGSEKINGGEAGGTVILSAEGQGITFVYVDATVGWRSIHENQYTTSGENPAFVAATGGTITTCGDYKVHKFTGPGTFTVSCAGNSTGSNEISYLVVGGGGAAADGGAGAGGFREGKSPQTPYTASPTAATSGLPVTATGYPVTIGAGATHTPPAPGRKGSDTTFAGSSPIVSAGGGYGSSDNNGSSGGPGGSGGANRGGPGGTGNTPPTTPAQGNNGGASTAPIYGAAGGGGAGTVGNNFPGPRVGGTGVTSEISGSSTGYAGGGSGASPPAPEAPREPTNTGGASRHPGAKPAPGPQCGVVNTGGGGGGVWCGTNGGGGSGIVIIRYKYQ